MHLFLTGEVGCGKSTLLRRVLDELSLPLGGFCTGFGPARKSPTRTLYLWPAGATPLYDPAHAVAHFAACGATPLPARFDALGCATLHCPQAKLVVMDECGRLEQDALAFQRAVLAILDGDTPVLGVVRHGLPLWTAQIAAHPKVTVLAVTADNRDSLPCVVRERLGL